MKTEPTLLSDFINSLVRFAGPDLKAAEMRAEICEAYFQISQLFPIKERPVMIVDKDGHA